MRALIGLLVVTTPLLAAPVPKSVKANAVDQQLIGDWRKVCDDFDDWAVRIRLLPDGECTCQMHLTSKATLGVSSRGCFLMTSSGGSGKFPVIRFDILANSNLNGEWSLLEIDDETLRLGHPTDGTEIEFRRVKEK